MTTTSIERKKKETLFTLRRLPRVIEMHVGLRVGLGGNPPKFYAYHLSFWLRNYAIPGKSPGLTISYPDGNLLSRGDAELLDSALSEILGNFVILKPRINAKKAKKVAAALRRASIIHWKSRNRKFHAMRVVEDPKNHKPLHQCLLELLRGSRFDIRREEEVERIAEYFVIFCQGNKKSLKELALRFHSATRREDGLFGALSSRD